MRLAGLLLLVPLAMSGCGGGEREATANRTPSPTATPTATPEPPPKRARSVKACRTLWNADEALGSTPQVSHTEFLADLVRTEGRTPVQVAYHRGHCFVTAPIGPRRIAWFVAVCGRAPYTNPERRNLKPGEQVLYNGRALRDGRIARR